MEGGNYAILPAYRLLFQGCLLEKVSRIRQVGMGRGRPIKAPGLALFNHKAVKFLIGWDSDDGSENGAGSGGEAGLSPNHSKRMKKDLLRTPMGASLPPSHWRLPKELQKVPSLKRCHELEKVCL